MVATSQDPIQPGGDVGIVVEAEHGVRLGQRFGEFGAVAFGQATHSHDRADAAVLAVGGVEQGVDGILLRCVDEAAGVHHDRLGRVRVVNEAEPCLLYTSRCV